MPSMTNPLRYPGGKSTLVPYISDLIQANHLNGCTFVEPFAGSAAVGLALLQQNTIGRLKIVERDILLYSFWYCVFHENEELCELIEETDISIETWNELDRYRDMAIGNDEHVTRLELGFAGLFFNRTNFSGILKANPIGGLGQTSQYAIDCRFKKELVIPMIRRLGELHQQVEVHHEDALIFLEQRRHIDRNHNTFVYLDPPYYMKGRQLYRHFFTDIEHNLLANIVTNNFGCDWLISYDDCDFIRQLYGVDGAQWRNWHFDYTVAGGIRRVADELLISNLELPPADIGFLANL